VCGYLSGMTRPRFSARFNALDNVAKPPNIAFETVFGRDRLTDVQAR